MSSSPKIKYRLTSVFVLAIFASSLFQIAIVYALNSSTQTWAFDSADEYTNNASYSVVASGDTYGKLLDSGGGTYATTAPSNLSAWTRRKAITVTEQGDTELTNYQVEFTVAYDADMQVDFDDLRFTSSDGTTLLDYWLESKTNSISASVWVEVPTIAASGSATIYMYYGNAGAGSVSNIENTMIFGDEFSGGSLDALKWPSSSGAVVSDGTLRLDAFNSDYIYATDADIDVNTTFEIKKKNPPSEAGRFGLNAGNNAFFAGLTSYTGFQAFNNGLLYTDSSDGDGYNQMDEHAFIDDWYRLKIERVSTTSNKFYEDGVLLRTYETDIPTSDDVHPLIRDYIEVDWVLVRQYATTEPAVTWGDEASTNLENWTRRSAYVVHNNIASELTDYQVQVPVAYDSDMQADFDDLRFTSSDGTTLLDYWLESKTNSISASVWVEVPTIAASSNATIYMYYGNAGASSASNIADTFIFGDDFSSDTSASYSLSFSGEMGGMSVTDGVLHMTNQGGNTVVAPTSQGTPPSSYIVEARMYNFVGGGLIGVLGFQDSVASPNSGYVAQFMDVGVGVELFTAAHLITSAYSFNPATFYNIKGTFVSGTIKSTLERSTTVTATESTWISGYYGLRTFTVDSDVDWMFVRAYASTEPTILPAGLEVSLATFAQVSIENDASTAPVYTDLGAFTETRGITGSQGDTYYQLSNDGTNWKYWNGSAWAAAATGNFTDAATVNTNLPQFVTDIDKGQLYFKAFLVGNNEPVEIDTIEVTYEPLTTSISAATQTLAESAGTGTVIAQLSESFTQDVVIPYTVSGTATGGGTDHNLANGNITVTEGVTSGTASFSVIDDSSVEGDETIIVTLGTPDFGELSGTTAQTITITDDDVNSVSGGTPHGSNPSNDSSITDEPQDSTPTEPSTEPVDSIDELSVPDHWSSGYIENLTEQEDVMRVALAVPSFMEMLVKLILNPNQYGTRAEALEFMMVFAGYETSTITIDGLIQHAHSLAFIDGYPGGNFEADSSINRVEALKMASRIFDVEVPEKFADELLSYYGLDVNPFSDVDLSQWYAPFLLNAYTHHVVSGYGDGTFGPGNNVTYAELLKIITLMDQLEDAVSLASELEE